MTSLLDAVDDHIKWDIESKAPGTANSYKSHLRGFTQWVLEYEGVCDHEVSQGICHDCASKIEVGDIKQKHVKRSLQASKKAGKAPPTLETQMVVVRGFLESEHPGEIDDLDLNLRDEDIIGSWGDTRQEREERNRMYYLTPEEVDELADNVPDPTFRNELIVKLLYHTGLRQRQLTEVRLADHELDERLIRVGSRKSGSTYSVWYGASLKPLMQQWLDTEREALSPGLADESQYLIPGVKKPQLRPKYINDKIVRPAAEAAGLQSRSYTDSVGRERAKVTGHVLRHSFAVSYVQDGGDIRRLQQLMGHSDIETTEKYLRFKTDEIRDARARHGPQ